MQPDGLGQIFNAIKKKGIFSDLTADVLQKKLLQTISLIGNQNAAPLFQSPKSGQNAWQNKCFPTKPAPSPTCFAGPPRQIANSLQSLRKLAGAMIRQNTQKTDNDFKGIFSDKFETPTMLLGGLGSGPNGGSGCLV